MNTTDDKSLEIPVNPKKQSNDYYLSIYDYPSKQFHHRKITTEQTNHVLAIIVGELGKLSKLIGGIAVYTLLKPYTSKHHSSYWVFLCLNE